MWFGCTQNPNNIAQTERVAEKVALIVIPNEVRNLSGFECQEKRDSSARSVPRHDNVLSFSASCGVYATRSMYIVGEPCEINNLYEVSGFAFSVSIPRSLTAFSTTAASIFPSCSSS